MPEKMASSAGSSARLCARCQSASAPFVVRSEYLCRDCFTAYIATKIVKRMDSYKVRSAAIGAKRILLPVSLGPASMTVLHMLDRQLQGQIDKTGRVGYELQVLYVGERLSNEDGAEPSKQSNDAWDLLQQRYPRHEYHQRSISDALSLIVAEELLPMTGPEDVKFASARSLSGILGLLPSPTSRSDFLQSLIRRLIAHTARELSCTSIIFGHTSTRLAEVVLSETAKGRGAMLPYLVGEAAELEGLRYMYPARELMRIEVETWISQVEEPLGRIWMSQKAASTEITQPPVSAKDTTIDQLMKQYFEGVEANYPSIVANVVRTSSRLRAPEASNAEGFCGLCSLPINDGRTGLTGWGGDQAASNFPGEAKGVGDANFETPVSLSSGKPLCYGCARSLDGSRALKSS